MVVNTNGVCDLDAILLELGNFGPFQIKNYILLTLSLLATGVFSISFLFTSANPQYRCFVPECENLTNTTFNTEWLRNVIPFENDEPKQCYRYENVHSNNTINKLGEKICPASWFERKEIQCSDGYVFNTDHTSIANDFDILCKDQWKLTLPGTIHSVGGFFSMPLTGVFSDKFGRKFALSVGLLASAIAGLCRSFSPNYFWYIFFEFLDSGIGLAAYVSAFVLGTEFVSPSKRVLIATILFCAYPFGETIVGTVAWNVLSWRHMLRYLYGPGLIFIVYFWIAPESVRWLISKGRHTEVEKIIKAAAKQNGVILSDIALSAMQSNSGLSSTSSICNLDYKLTDVLKTIPMLVRLVNCSICWFTCIFVYYGLSLNTVEIAGNIYLNFILVAFVEIPGNLASYFFLERLGRKKSLCGSLFLAGISCIACIFLNTDMGSLKLILVLFGKGAITFATTVTYIYTAELFPTPLRQTLVGICSMFGRIGSMLAPQMPLLVQLWNPLPMVLFGFTSCISGLLALSFPETLNIKLPDTIEEAMNIGKKV